MQLNALSTQEKIQNKLLSPAEVDIEPHICLHWNFVEEENC